MYLNHFDKLKGIKMTASEVQSQAYSRAVGNSSARNYDTIISGFVSRGISADDITPRVNVFTYNAWKSQGRQVRKGERGIKILTWIPIAGKKDEDGKVKIKVRPRNAVVFHVSQTDEVKKVEVA